MAKQVTIASLNRVAARTEAEFVETCNQVLQTEPMDRVAEFFEKMNVPRSVLSETNLEPLGRLTTDFEVGTFEEERLISDGIQKFMERHVKKVKWHAARPSEDGTNNTLLVVRLGILATVMRLARLDKLLKTNDELTPVQWAIAREIMNKSYLAFRSQINELGGAWIDSAVATQDRESLTAAVAEYYEFVDQAIRDLEEYRTRIEERRAELTVLPDGYPPVKPPYYFGGDVLGPGPWRQYWNNISERAHHFREALA